MCPTFPYRRARAPGAHVCSAARVRSCSSLRPPPTPAPPTPKPPPYHQTFTDLYFWLLGTIAVLGAGVPYARRVAGPYGKPTLKVPLPEGLATDDAQQPVTEARRG